MGYQLVEVTDMIGRRVVAVAYNAELGQLKMRRS